MVVRRAFRLIGAVEGEGEFIILRLPNAAQGHTQALGEGEILARQIALHMIIKQLEVAVFIGGDQPADLLQRGFFGGFAKRGVIAAGAGFHHATRDQFACTAATNGSFRIQLNLIASAIAFKGRGKIPTRISQHAPTAERIAMLGFFHAPIFDSRDEIRIIGENAREVGHVIRRIALHHGGSLDQRHDFRINLGRIEAIPTKLINMPMLHEPTPSALP